MRKFRYCEKQLGNRFPRVGDVDLKKADVGDEAQDREVRRGRASAKWGKIDILVNLVGGFWGGKPIAETSLAEWQAMFDLNLKPTFLCCRAVVPIMQAGTSGGASCQSRRAAVCKARATTRLTRSRRARSRRSPRRSRRKSSTDGVMVNAIAPKHNRHGSEPGRDAESEARKLGKAGGHSAKTIAYLCSDDCRVTSGAVVPVYGKA